jgi:hypothetical protein
MSKSGKAAARDEAAEHGDASLGDRHFERVSRCGTAHENPRKIARIIFYEHVATSAEVSSKDIRPVSDFLEMDAALQEPAPCFGSETRPEGHAVRRRIETPSTLQLLPDGQRWAQQRRMDTSQR